MRKLWLWLYRSEIDLRIERRIAHVFRWHTDGCRGSSHCDPFYAGRSSLVGYRTTMRNRWWRWADR